MTIARTCTIFILTFVSFTLASQVDSIERLTGNNPNWFEESKYASWENGLLISIRNDDDTRDTISLKDIIIGQDKKTIFRDQHNQIVNFETFKDKVILLDFWFIRCPPCIVDLPGLDLLNKKVNSSEFEIITFANDSMPEIRNKLLSKREFNFRIIPNVFIVNNSYPYKVLISRDQTFVNSKVGGTVGEGSIKSLLDKYLPLVTTELKKIKEP
ncbi:MAG: redoxin domain-containing protein [Saprospiraceae bacterium]|nr:redoxin domain-containing protein [Saprospiraceae bacterium]